MKLYQCVVEGEDIMFVCGDDIVDAIEKFVAEWNDGEEDAEDPLIEHITLLSECDQIVGWPR